MWLSLDPQMSGRYFKVGSEGVCDQLVAAYGDNWLCGWVFSALCDGHCEVSSVCGVIGGSLAREEIMRGHGFKNETVICWERGSGQVLR